MSDQIVVNKGGGHGDFIEKITDSAEFSRVFVGDKGIDNWQLVLYLLSQRDVTSMLRCFYGKNILSHG